MNLAILRQDLRDHLGQDVYDLDDESADRLLNRAYWELLDKFPFRNKEAYMTLPTIIGTRDYTTDATVIESLNKIAIESNVNQAHEVIDKMSVDVYESNYINNSDNYAKPTHYVRYGNKITLYPTPDAIYTIIMYYNAILSDLALESDEPNTPKNWHEILLMGAVARGFLMLQDYQRSDAAKQQWMSLVSSVSMNEGEDNKDTPRAGLRIGYSGYDWD